MYSENCKKTNHPSKKKWIWIEWLHRFLFPVKLKIGNGGEIKCKLFKTASFDKISIRNVTMISKVEENDDDDDAEVRW